MLRSSSANCVLLQKIDNLSVFHWFSNFSRLLLHYFIRTDNMDASYCILQVIIYRKYYKSMEFQNTHLVMYFKYEIHLTI